MQSREQIDGSKIKRALSQVHLAERSSTHADGILEASDTLFVLREVLRVKRNWI